MKKYKKHSLKNKRQKRRYHFSKKYSQRGGGFMDVISNLTTIEGRAYTCMTLHPIEPLVAVGDDAGTVTLFEINVSGSLPKILAQLTGLPRTTVKFVEFHPILPIVTAACSDRVLMWRVDQINREQEDRQIQPSHIVMILNDRERIDSALDEAYKEYEEKNVKTVLHENKQRMETLHKEMSIIKGRKDRANDDVGSGTKIVTQPNSKDTFGYTFVKVQLSPEEIVTMKEDITKLDQKYQEMNEEHKKLSEQVVEATRIDKTLKKLENEMKMIEQNVKNEVSCVAFHPNKPYIAVGVNNDNRYFTNKIAMCRFNMEEGTSQVVYDVLPHLYRDFNPTGNSSIKVSTISFSRNGEIFAYVTNHERDIVVRNFSENNRGFQVWEQRNFAPPGKSVCTCISPMVSTPGKFATGFYGPDYVGPTTEHTFMIGCNDGSLKKMEITVVKNAGQNRIIIFTSGTFPKEAPKWNSGQQSILSIAVHPLLPLFASGSLDHAKIWSFHEDRELESLAFQPGVVPVRSIGLNQNFLAVCGPGNVRIYSCNADDYRGLNEELKKSPEIINYGTELLLAGRQGEPCSICNEPMNDPLSQKTLRFGPEDAVEKNLECGHNFHKKCIEEWRKQGKSSCPLCRAQVDISQATPQRIIQARQQFKGERNSEIAGTVIKSLVDRSQRYEPRRGFGQGAAAASSAFAELTPEQQRPREQQPPESKSNGGGKNKYSRKKYRSKKSKFHHKYSNSNKK